MSEQMGSGSFARISTSRWNSLRMIRARYALVQQRIREYRKAGNSEPDDLVRMERSLMTECMAASQGR